MWKTKTQTIKQTLHYLACDRCETVCYDAVSTSEIYNQAIDIAKGFGWQFIGSEWLCKKCIQELILPSRSTLKIGDKVKGIGSWADSFYVIKSLDYREAKITPDISQPHKGATCMCNQLPLDFSLVVKVDD